VTALLVAPFHERVSAALRRLNTIEDLLVAAEGKVQVIDGQIQAMTGNHRPRTHMTMPPMVNMAAPFTPSQHSQHYQPQFHFDPSASRSGEPATDNPAVFHFHPGTRNDHHPPASQSAHSWPPSYQAMNSHPGQHGNMDLAATFHATASYNPKTRTEQEAMLDAAIFLSVACYYIGLIQ
jgi:hypothetical protein